MKTAISIPDDIFAAADKLAADMGLSRSELYRTALATFLAAHDRALVTERLDAVYGDGQSGALDPVLDRMQRAGLAREDW